MTIKDGETVYKRSVSIPMDMYKLALVRAGKLGFGFSFSAYVAKLISEDIAKTPTLPDLLVPVVVEDSPETIEARQKLERRAEARNAAPPNKPKRHKR